MFSDDESGVGVGVGGGALEVLPPELEEPASGSDLPLVSRSPRLALLKEQPIAETLPPPSDPLASLRFPSLRMSGA